MQKNLETILFYLCVVLLAALFIVCDGLYMVMRPYESVATRIIFFFLLGCVAFLYKIDK